MQIKKIQDDGKDGTGLIYITGKYPGLDPVKDIGKKLEVSGMVRVKDDAPYIEATYIEAKIIERYTTHFSLGRTEKVYNHAHLLQRNR